MHQQTNRPYLSSLALRDKVFVVILASLFMISLSYIYAIFWKDILLSIVLIVILFACAIKSIYQVNECFIANVITAMIGLIIIFWISVISLTACSDFFRLTLFSKISILLASLILIYNTHRLFIERIQMSRLILAIILDMALAIFLLSRPHLGTMGPGLGRENR
jgi:hypothetical protein